MNNKKIQDIVNKFERMQKLGKAATVFLGAGASVSAGIPTAQGVIEFISKDPELSKLINTNTSNYFEVMEQLDPAERKRLLYRFINDVKISETYLILAVLIYLGYVDTVVTTNFDSLVERSLSLFHEEINTIDISNNVSIAGHSISGPTLFYLHGRYNNVWQLNTIDELNKIKPRLNSLISRLSQNRFWVVVGYSGNDPVLDELCKLEKFDEGLYWIGFREENPDRHVEKRLLNKPTKNTYFISGHTSDSFFRGIYEKLEIRDSNLTKMLSTFIIFDKLKPKVNSVNYSTLSINNQIRLSPESINWINELKDVSVENEKNSLFHKVVDSLGNIFSKLFTPVDPFVRDLQVNLISDNFDDALTIVDTALTEDSNNYLAHYYKGIVLASKAWKIKKPSKRQSIYKKAKKSFDKAISLMQKLPKTPKEHEQLHNSVMSFWADEYNKAVNIQNDKSLFNKTENPHQTSLEHLQNAVILNPDNGMTYQVMSSMLFQLDRIDEAITSYEKAMELLPKPSLKDYEYIISLYLYNKQYKKGIELSEEGQEIYPNQIMFVQFLADAYIQAGKREKAISLVEEMIEDEPENPQYRRVLGTQVYQDVEEISNQVSELYKELFELRQSVKGQNRLELEQKQLKIKALKSEIETKNREIDEFSEISIRELSKVVELVQDDESANFILGIIYQNRAANLFERRNNTTNSEKANKYDTRAKENLEPARKYYERATEINPENPENWQSLFQVYTALGKEAEATNAKHKYDELKQG